MVGGQGFIARNVHVDLTTDCSAQNCDCLCDSLLFLLLSSIFFIFLGLFPCFHCSFCLSVSPSLSLSVSVSSLLGLCACSSLWVLSSLWYSQGLCLSLCARACETLLDPVAQEAKLSLSLFYQSPTAWITGWGPFTPWCISCRKRTERCWTSL